MTSYPKLPGYPGVAEVVCNNRRQYPYYITAKGYRALGVPIPSHIPDDAVVELHIEGGGREG